jgi:osmoprotectant transport system permease protein
MSLSEYLSRRWYELAVLAGEHALLVALAMVAATVLGLTIGLLSWNRPRIAGLATATAGGLLTIPSFALLGLLIPLLGLGWTPAVVALILYSLLPILRNTIVGLREVDSTIIEAARGMGLTPFRLLAQVQLPLAWPYVLAGVRVATQMVIGIGAMAAYVAGPGLGTPIFDGLSRLGSANALNEAIAGTVGIVLIALAFDLCFVVLRRLTTSRGVHV